MNEPRGPLAGLFVLDLSRVLVGPFCTMLLGDLGARVIKIEHPDGGDVTRGWVPLRGDDRISADYLAVNRPVPTDSCAVLRRRRASRLGRGSALPDERGTRREPRGAREPPRRDPGDRRAGRLDRRVPRRRDSVRPGTGPFEALSSATARALGAVASASGVDFVASPIHLGVPAPIRFPPGLDEHGEALRREFGLPPPTVVPGPGGPRNL